jgi:hypothetical protein
MLASRVLEQLSKALLRRAGVKTLLTKILELTPHCSGGTKYV